MREPNALVIAMYPARALVQDQLAKWRNLGSKLGLKVGQIDGSVPLNQRHQIFKDKQHRGDDSGCGARLADASAEGDEDALAKLEAGGA